MRAEAVRVLLLVVQPLTRLALCVDHAVVSALRPLAPWCDCCVLPGPCYNELNWWHVEQSLRRSEHEQGEE